MNTHPEAPRQVTAPPGLDLGALTWETPLALTKAASTHRDRILTAAWVAVSVAATFYAVIGIYVGLAQQDLTARSGALVCEYRFDLVRDRLVSLFDQKPLRWADHEELAAADLSNLLRETRALCAGSDSDLGRRLDRLLALQREFLDRSSRHADARRELLAL